METTTMTVIKDKNSEQSVIIYSHCFKFTFLVNAINIKECPKCGAVVTTIIYREE